jgi:hypothetical protein
VLLYESALGLSPWDVLSQGISGPRRSPSGRVAVAVCVLVIAWTFGIGHGRNANGLYRALRRRAARGPRDRLCRTSLAARIVFMVAGVVVIGLHRLLYRAGMGAGPRDSLMLVVAPGHIRIGVARAAIGSPSVVGFALGGTVGIPARSSSPSGSGRVGSPSAGAGPFADPGPSCPARSG